MHSFIRIFFHLFVHLFTQSVSHSCTLFFPSFLRRLHFFSILLFFLLLLRFLHVLTSVFHLLRLLQLFTPETEKDPLISTFPRITKCTFHYYGPSGEITQSDYQCLLPQNLLNEKVFIVMWFWLIILATVTAMEVREKMGIASRDSKVYPYAPQSPLQLFVVFQSLYMQ